jgi:DNA-binding XRE family transcriptional regulator
MTQRKAVKAIRLVTLIAREEREHAGFAAGVEAIAERRAFLNQFVTVRERLGLAQEEVAARAGVLQPAVARLESGDIDPRLSTLQKHAGALGWRVMLMPTKGGAGKQSRRRE